MSEAFAMLTQHGRQERRIGGVALSDDLPVTDQSAFDFGVVDLVSKFGVAWWRFAAAQDLRVRFKQTDDFRNRRYTLFLQDALRRLCDDLLDQRDECCKLLSQAPRQRI